MSGAQSYRHPGRILFTTVSLAGDVNAYSLLHGWLSNDEEVLSREQITGGTPQKTYEQQNVQAMTDSKTAATKVALERLGYKVPAHGNGAVVIQLVAQSPADGKLAVGDVITAVDGHPIALDEQLVAAVRAHKPGDVVSFTFTRGTAAPQTVAITSIDDGKGVAKVGVGLATKDLSYDFPVTVSIDTGRVSGPSAGLAFTLALLDNLGNTDLTGGKKVAVTGTIDVDGTVGPVGGVAQKTVTARRAGAIAFLVPPEEEKDAKAHAGKMKILTIRTLDDALKALVSLGGNPLQPASPASSTSTTSSSR